MSSWSPQPAGLQEILQTIHESTDMNVTVQRNITQVSLHSVGRCSIYKLIWSPPTSSETEQFHACTRLHRISSPYPHYNSRGGSDSNHCWIPFEEQFAPHPERHSRSCRLCQGRSVAGIHRFDSDDSQCRRSGYSGVSGGPRTEELARVPPTVGQLA